MKIQQLWADWSTEPENMIKPGNTWKDWGCARTADNIAVFLVESVEYLCSLMDLWHAEPTRRAAWRITNPTQPAWIAGHESMYDYNCNQITTRRWLISILMSLIYKILRGQIQRSDNWAATPRKCPLPALLEKVQTPQFDGQKPHVSHRNRLKQPPYHIFKGNSPRNPPNIGTFLSEFFDFPGDILFLQGFFMDPVLGRKAENDVVFILGLTDPLVTPLLPGEKNILCLSAWMVDYLWMLLIMNICFMFNVCVFSDFLWGFGDILVLTFTGDVVIGWGCAKKPGETTWMVKEHTLKIIKINISHSKQTYKHNQPYMPWNPRFLNFFWEHFASRKFLFHGRWSGELKGIRLGSGGAIYGDEKGENTMNHWNLEIYIKHQTHHHWETHIDNHGQKTWGTTGEWNQIFAPPIIVLKDMSAFRHLFLVPESLFNLWHSNFAPDADPIVPLSPIPRVRRWQSFCDLVPLSCGSRRTWLSCLLVSDHIFAILFLKAKLIPSQFKAEHNWVAFVSSHGLFIFLWWCGNRDFRMKWLTAST